MKLWIKKISVVLITFMTLGVYIPPTYLNATTENDEFVSAKANFNDDSFIPVAKSQLEDEEVLEELDTSEYLIDLITEQAKVQTFSKLGPRIMPQIEDDFSTIILPQMEEVIRTVIAEADEDESQFYGISEQPTAGYGEKIFHLYNYRTNMDIARFHVRRDNRPGEGYWFNFHYHLSSDGFEKHNSIGEIYWSKDTPPKWMA
ncbi:YpjP family protein [Aquibacillus saliphilus]|uniref:YpjP family protein n=1 Tax=Aquibacillus saliphilus TaxID=1909422 RepID=UPI001CF05F7F|nr:YpjP family protein [Aquibacillus saliphilus]